METPPPASGFMADEPQVAATSVWSKIFNMFVAPRDVFEELRDTERSRVANWLTPAALVALMSLVVVWVMFSQPAIIQNIRDQQDKQFDQMVAQGKMTQDQANGAKLQMERIGPTIMKITGSIGSVVGTGIGLMVMATIVLTLVSFLGSERISFGKSLETAGMASSIMLVGMAVGVCLIVIKGNMLATLGPALFISEFNPENKAHLWASSFNVMSIWYLAVLSLGVAVMARIPWAKAATVIFGLWLAYRAIVIWKGWAASGM